MISKLKVEDKARKCKNNTGTGQDTKTNGYRKK